MRSVAIGHTPLNKGDRLVCIYAPESGNPLTEGRLYTVKQYQRNGGRAWRDVGGDGPIKELDLEPGVELAELPGNYFLASRFELVVNPHV